MKAILEFNLPEDSEDHELCVNAYRYHNTLFEFNQHLRGMIKYNSDKYTDKEIDLLIKIREEFHDMLNNNNVNLDI
jgi:hypothetical protein